MIELDVEGRSLRIDVSDASRHAENSLEGAAARRACRRLRAAVHPARAAGRPGSRSRLSRGCRGHAVTASHTNQLPAVSCSCQQQGSDRHEVLRYGMRATRNRACSTPTTACAISRAWCPTLRIDLLPESIERLRRLDAATLPWLTAPLACGPCGGQVGKFICVGLKYSDHAAESTCGARRADPVPEGDLVHRRPERRHHPAARVAEDGWEVELGVVIGTPGSTGPNRTRSRTSLATASSTTSRSARISWKHRSVGQGSRAPIRSADRPVAGDDGRSPAAGGVASLARCGRHPQAGRFHENADFRRRYIVSTSATYELARVTSSPWHSARRRTRQKPPSTCARATKSVWGRNRWASSAQRVVAAA